VFPADNFEPSGPADKFDQQIENQISRANQQPLLKRII
jgi:hypothetical protein